MEPFFWVHSSIRDFLCSYFCFFENVIQSEICCSIYKTFTTSIVCINSHSAKAGVTQPHYPCVCVLIHRTSSHLTHCPRLLYGQNLYCLYHSSFLFSIFSQANEMACLFFFFFFNAHLVVLNFPLFTSEMWGDICAFVCVYVYKHISNNSTVEGRKFELWISQLEIPWGTNWVRRLSTWRDIFDVAHIYMYVLSKCTCHHFISISLVKLI